MEFEDAFQRDIQVSRSRMDDLQDRIFLAVLDLGDGRTVHFRGDPGVDDALTASPPSRSLICLEIEPLTIQEFFSSLLDLIQRELPVFNQTPGKLNVRLKAKNRLG